MIKKVIKIVLLLFVLYLLAGIVLAPLLHKKPEGDFQELLPSEGKSSERILCVDDNEEALFWRLRVIEKAREEIILTTFDFRDDDSGKDIMAALLTAAGRGVKVKILVDGINGVLFLKNSDYFGALVSHPNVEARLYNPVNLFTVWDVNYRMHDKYLTADNSVYILGGRNTNNLFLGNYSEKQNVDRDILVYEMEEDGENTLRKLRKYFGSIWELPCLRELSYKENEKRKAAAKELEKRYCSMKEKWPGVFSAVDWTGATMDVERIDLCTNPIEPVNKKPELWNTVQGLMEEGEEILIQTPYIICSKDMYKGLSRLSEGGKQVQILLNAIESGANPFGCIDYVNQKKKVLGTGAEVFECMGEHSLHTKTILIDDRISVVGSYNFDMRSTYLDTEMMLVIDSQKLNQSLREGAESLKARAVHVLPDGTGVRGEDYPDKELSAGKKVGYLFLRLVIWPFRHLL